MRTPSGVLKSIERFEHKKSQPCTHREGRVLNGRSRTVTDDSGSLAITAWTCARCGGLIEEIRILSQDGKADRHRIRYAVRPQHALERFSAAPL